MKAHAQPISAETRDRLHETAAKLQAAVKAEAEARKAMEAFEQLVKHEWDRLVDRRVQASRELAEVICEHNLVALAVTAEMWPAAAGEAA